MADLYLARHGQTVLNADGRIRGLADPPLDETGLREAERLADDLASSGARAVASSPLQRAHRTAEAIAERLGLPPTVDPRFDDRDYGPQTGRLRSEVEAEYGSLDAAPGVEPVEHVLARVRPALDAILDEHAPDDVIVVTHDAVIRPLLASIDPDLEVRVPTGSWARLRRLDGGWSVLDVDRTGPVDPTPPPTM